ncbi:hypothetical protein V2G26_013474 [Clonostachys chloroleuca]
MYVAGLWLSRLSLDMLWQNVKLIPDPEVNDTSSRPTHLTFSWISGYQVRMGHDIRSDVIIPELEEPLEKFILPQITCVKWRTSADTDAEEYSFSKDIIMFPSTPSIEIMVRGVLKRMILRRGPTRFHLFLVGVPEAEQGMEALQKREYGMYRGSYVEATLDFAATETDISGLNGSGRLFYVPWYDYKGVRLKCGPAYSYCLLLELVCGEMGRFRRIGLLNFGLEYRDLYSLPQVSEQGYPCWKYEQSTGEHTFFIV